MNRCALCGKLNVLKSAEKIVRPAPMCHFQPIVLQDLFKVNVSSAFIFFSMISNFSRNGMLCAALFSTYVFFFRPEDG